MSLFAFASLDPATYTPHDLHRKERAWAETNCYVDVWIEILSSLKLNPIACLPIVFGIDFDGDQWTFFKPSHEDLFELYGVDVQELNVWRTLLENSTEQLRRGRLVLTEADAFHLPDTVGTDYQTQHTKTTIGIQEIDPEQRVMGYFHNGGYHRLSGNDFANTFRLDRAADSTFMPFFAELVRFDRLARRSPQELARLSRAILIKHLARRPAANPVAAFNDRFTRDVEWLKTEGLARYHSYAFATLRQFGAAFDLGGSYLRWLEDNGQGNFAAAAAEFESMSQTTKALLLKTARAVTSSRPQGLEVMVAELAQRWSSGMALIERGLG